MENVLLKAGDFEGETIIGEIKREKDFYNSIVDKRAYYQPKKMLRTGKKCYWIIAGDPTDERRKLRPVLDTIFNLVLDYRMNLIPVPKDEAAIAYAIHNIMERKENRKREGRNNRRGKNKTDNRNKLGIELLELIPGIGLESAKTITEWYPTIKQLTGATQKELEAIPEIGRKRAQIIYNILRGKYRDFFHFVVPAAPFRIPTTENRKTVDRHQIVSALIEAC